MIVFAASDALPIDVTNTASGPVLVALCGVFVALCGVWTEAIRSRRRAGEAKASADKTKKSIDLVVSNTKPVSNGFAQSVLDRLERIEATQRRFEDGLLSHLEYHLAVRPEDIKKGS